MVCGQRCGGTKSICGVAKATWATGTWLKAYSNALQAVSLRPNNLSYWHALMQTKIALQPTPVSAGR